MSKDRNQQPQQTNNTNDIKYIIDLVRQASIQYEQQRLQKISEISKIETPTINSDTIDYQKIKKGQEFITKLDPMYHISKHIPQLSLPFTFLYSSLVTIPIRTGTFSSSILGKLGSHIGIDPSFLTFMFLTHYMLSKSTKPLSGLYQRKQLDIYKGNLPATEHLYQGYRTLSTLLSVGYIPMFMPYWLSLGIYGLHYSLPLFNMITSLLPWYLQLPIKPLNFLGNALYQSQLLPFISNSLLHLGSFLNFLNPYNILGSIVKLTGLHGLLSSTLGKIPIIGSMFFGSPAMTAMSLMMITGIGTSMLRSISMRRYMPKKINVMDIEKQVSASQQMYSILNQIISNPELSKQIKPLDVLQLQALFLIEQHTSVIPLIYELLHTIKEQKQKSSEFTRDVIYKNVYYPRATFQHWFEKPQIFLEKLLYRYDPITQLVTYLITGKKPSELYYEKYVEPELRKKEIQKQSIVHGINEGIMNLLTTNAIMLTQNAKSYEEKVITLLSAIYDINRAQLAELITIRKQGFNIQQSLLREINEQLPEQGDNIFTRIWKGIIKPIYKFYTTSAKSSYHLVRSLYNLLKKQPREAKEAFKDAIQEYVRNYKDIVGIKAITNIITDITGLIKGMKSYVESKRGKEITKKDFIELVRELKNILTKEGLKEISSSIISKNKELYHSIINKINEYRHEGVDKLYKDITDIYRRTSDRISLAINKLNKIIVKTIYGEEYIKLQQQINEAQQLQIKLQEKSGYIFEKQLASLIVIASILRQFYELYKSTLQSYKSEYYTIKIPQEDKDRIQKILNVQNVPEQKYIEQYKKLVLKISTGEIYRFKKGGVVPGDERIKKDIIPALLQPGEYVLSHEHLQKLGRFFIDYITSTTKSLTQKIQVKSVSEILRSKLESKKVNDIIKLQKKMVNKLDDIYNVLRNMMITSMNKTNIRKDEDFLIGDILPKQISNILLHGKNMIKTLLGKFKFKNLLKFGKFGIFSFILSFIATNDIKKSLGATIGSVAGAAIGSSFGPFGTLLGSILGGFIGETIIPKIFDFIKSIIGKPIELIKKGFSYIKDKIKHIIKYKPDVNSDRYQKVLNEFTYKYYDSFSTNKLQKILESGEINGRKLNTNEILIIKSILSSRLDKQNNVAKNNKNQENIKRIDKSDILNSILRKQIFVESAGNIYAVSKVGAKGLAQFMPSTWKYIWTNKQFFAKYNPNLLNYENIPDIYNVNAQVDAQKAYMKYLLEKFNNKIEWALAAYNYGETRVMNLYKKFHGDFIRAYKHLPNETQKYVEKILGINFTDISNNVYEILHEMNNRISNEINKIKETNLARRIEQTLDKYVKVNDSDIKNKIDDEQYKKDEQQTNQNIVVLNQTEETRYNNHFMIFDKSVRMFINDLLDNSIYAFNQYLHDYAFNQYN